jgi:hypothetical protein
MMTNDAISLNFISCLFFFVIMGSALPMTQAVVSEKCQTELNTLLNNPALAVTSGGTCDYDSSGSVLCTYDYTNITADFSSACRQTGGKPYQEDFTCAFRENVGSVTAKVDNYYKSYPFCAGASCSDTEIRELFSSNVTAAVQQALPSFECAVSASLQTGATRIWHHAVMAAFVTSTIFSYV